MVRKKIKKSKDTEPKKTQGRRKQQTQQVVEPASHGPMETSDPYSGMFTSMMPMVMMIMMFAIITPMLKGVTKE
jgi:archaellum biogenesis protein FlaJ (TadC family)